MESEKQLSVGDRVRFTSKFLRNTGQYTGLGPSLIGTVVSVLGEYPIGSCVGIVWDDDRDYTLHFEAMGVDPEYVSCVQRHGVGVNSANLEKSVR